MTSPRLFAEIPAGLAGVSLRLHGGPHCRPPISRMGSKVGYSGAILGALGLRSGSGADAFLWVEADDDVRGLLRAYPDPAMLREIAGIIRGWKDEEPRALWERLRAERKERGARSPSQDSAAWMIEGLWSFRRCEPESGFNPGVETGKAWNAGAAVTAARCDRLADAGAREVAAWAASAVRTMPQAQARGATDGDFLPRVAPSGVVRYAHDAPANGFEAMAMAGWPPVAILPRAPEPAALAQMMGTPSDLEGCVIYSDPPYEGTTGYAHDLPRAEVVRLMLGYADLGATVAVSEAVPLPELVAAGWDAVDIAGERKGQRRTFSREQGEWLTMNRAPVHKPAEQVGLFGGAA